MTYRDWVISKLNDTRELQEIDSIKSLGDFLLEIKTNEGKTVFVGVIDAESINMLEASNVYNSGPQTPNIIISKSKAVWYGDAINYLRKQNVGWGGIGEISHAFHEQDYGKIQKREFRFVEEGLLRHTHVLRLERLYDRVFKIHRKRGFSPVTIALINSYELSGEEVRNAVNKYGEFDAVLKTNPNGGPTANAYSAAAEVGADIFHWRELLGWLNKK